MLGDIQAFCFFFFVDSNSHHKLEKEEDSEREDESPSPNREGSNQLSDKAEIFISSIEERKAYRQGSPDSANSVNGNGTHRVVDLDFVKEQNGKDNDGTRNQSNDSSSTNGDTVGTCSNTDQTGKNTIQSHGEVRLLDNNPRGHDGGEGAEGCCKRGGHTDVGNKNGIGVQNRTTIETEPTEPKEENTDGGEGKRVPEDWLGAFRSILALTWPKNENTSEGCEASECVNHAGTCEVVEAHVVEESSAPLPRTGKRVSETNQQSGEDHEGGKLDSLSDCTRNDGCGRGCEHRLKEEVCPRGHIKLVAAGSHQGGIRHVTHGWDEEAAEADELLSGITKARIHQVESGDVISNQSHRDDEDVLKEDVDGVFLLAKS